MESERKNVCGHRSRKQPLGNSQQGNGDLCPTTTNHKELNLANNLNAFGSRVLPEPAKESPTWTQLEFVLWDPKQSTPIHCVQVSDLLKL